MDFNLTGFTAAQKQAFLDLLILAMYADGHLTTYEDEQLQSLLAGMGFTEESARHREFDAAVTRIRPMLKDIQIAKTHALLLADAFTVQSQQAQVLDAVLKIISSDFQMSTWESTLLSELRKKFRL